MELKVNRASLYIDACSPWEYCDQRTDLQKDGLRGPVGQR